MTAELIGAGDELQTMLTGLETLAEDHDDEAIQKHIDQAYENVAFHAEKPGSLLPDALRESSNKPLQQAAPFLHSMKNTGQPYWT